MFKNRVEIIGVISIILSIIICSIVLIIGIYLLYRYRKKTIFLNAKQINVDLDEQFKKDNSNFDEIKKREEEEEEINNSLKNEPTIIGELMRKSLQLAKTAEQVADHNEKRFSLKDNIHLHL
jgi:cbb3-type cytochrome oxidase subunit 3